MSLHVHTRFQEFDAFTLEELTLKRGIRFADEELAAVTNDAMPRNAFAGRSGSHGTTRAPGAPWKTQNLSHGPIG